MKKLFAATLLATTLAGIGFASAMSPAPSSPLSGDVIQVAGGCGLGYHRGPYGGCRPNGYVVRPVYRPIVVAPVRRCPPGQGMTRFGCRWR